MNDRYKYLRIPQSIIDIVDLLNRTTWPRKNAFYKFKSMVLQEIATPDGNDLQIFYRYRHYWAQFYHWDMSWDYKVSHDPENWFTHLANRWGDTTDNIDGNIFRPDDYEGNGDVMIRCISKHSHILARYIVRTENDEKVYHIPTNEFYYQAFETPHHKEVVKESPGFFALIESTKNTIGIIREGREQVDGINKCYNDLFQFLIDWFRHEMKIDKRRLTLTHPPP